ncbi:MAG: response regulator transcription factor [Kofleriaceae bacterium]|nr:response regulator transcription factor [Kofleriaceae bacterium]
MIRTFLVDDHPVVSEGIARYLNGQADMEVVGQVNHSEGLLDRFHQSGADIMVLDLVMPGEHGTKLVSQLSKGGVAVVVFSMYVGDALATELAFAGARGWVAKTEALTVLADIIRRVASGERMLAPAGDGAILATFSPRERQIFDGILAGKPLKVIAFELDLSSGTIHTYAHRLRQKLGVETIPDIVDYAHRVGLHLVLPR